MAIIIVDDSAVSQMHIKSILESAGYNDILIASAAGEVEMLLQALASRGMSSQVDLIMMDIMMPDIDGIEACRRIKSKELYQDVPVIMVTGKKDVDNLQKAFSAGAHDYITKPPNAVELLARVRSALKLKHETDRRKAREAELLQLKLQLEDANGILRRLSFADGLTGVANRRRFDEVLKQEWGRARRNNSPLSLILLDIDYFKKYNDSLGHQAGDSCLKQVAAVLKENLKRPSDLAARYGGEEFAIVLPNTELQGATHVAEIIRSKIEDLRIYHPGSEIDKRVTVSLGVSCLYPDASNSPEILLAKADKALYQAKQAGRNIVKTAS